MNGQPVNQLVDKLVHGGVPPVVRLEEVLDTTLKPMEENNPQWHFYQFELKNGSFKGGEFRLSQDGTRALLTLTPREEHPLKEDDLDLRPWGEVRDIDINPRIPPEGTDAYIYDVGGVRLTFQFTHNSRGLRTIAMEWGRSA